MSENKRISNDDNYEWIKNFVLGEIHRTPGIVISNFIRSIEYQRYLRRRAEDNPDKYPNPVAIPGTSKHEVGQAIDIYNYNMTQKNFDKYLEFIKGRYGVHILPERSCFHIDWFKPFSTNEKVVRPDSIKLNHISHSKIETATRIFDYAIRARNLSTWGFNTTGLSSGIPVYYEKYAKDVENLDVIILGVHGSDKELTDFMMSMPRAMKVFMSDYHDNIEFLDLCANYSIIKIK